MTENCIDLHTHSTASDGSETPSQILKEASLSGLRAVALTDHDTVSGIPEFLEASLEYDNIEAVPGVEISVDLSGKEVHIVGLFTDHKCSSLCELLSEIRDNRDKRNLQIIEKLRSMEYDITLEEVQAIAKGESLGRPHFARILVDKGYFASPQEVFDNCLKRGAPAYCSRILPKPHEAIDQVHNAGGIAIWAHPVYRLRNERYYVKRTLTKLVPLGLDGVETYYSTFTADQHKMMKELAAEFGLCTSGGSDFHGRNQPNIALGSGVNDNLRIPYGIFSELKKYHSERYALS